MSADEAGGKEAVRGMIFYKVSEIREDGEEKALAKLEEQGRYLMEQMQKRVRAVFSPAGAP